MKNGEAASRLRQLAIDIAAERRPTSRAHADELERIADGIDPVLAALRPPEGGFRTKSGRVLTDEDIQALADEAERGYDVDKLKPRRIE